MEPLPILNIGVDELKGGGAPDVPKLIDGVDVGALKLKPPAGFAGVAAAPN